MADPDVAAQLDLVLQPGSVLVLCRALRGAPCALHLARPPDGFNADKRTGLLARQSGDTLYQYRVLTTGALSCLAQIGVGWDAMTSIIGMSDHNGDRRGDVVAVRSDGILWLYAGRGG